MCTVIAYDPRRPSKTRRYVVSNDKATTLKVALSKAGYLVSLR